MSVDETAAPRTRRTRTGSGMQEPLLCLRSAPSGLICKGSPGLTRVGRRCALSLELCCATPVESRRRFASERRPSPLLVSCPAAPDFSFSACPDRVAGRVSSRVRRLRQDGARAGLCDAFTHSERAASGLVPSGTVLSRAPEPGQCDSFE